MTTKKIIIVLGMHRSGTSALTRGLRTLGVALGENLHPAGIDNPTGFWEDSDVIAINDRLLRHLGSAYDRVGLIDAAFDSDPVIDSLGEEARSLLLDKLGRFELWGMKDPRLPRLLPFWQRAINEIGAEAAYVIALRNPLSVADSLAHRNGFPPTKSYLLWLEHMLQAALYTKGEKRLVVAYDLLLSNARHELNRVANALGLPLPDDREVALYMDEFLDPGLRHDSRTDAELYSGKIEPYALADTYGLLSECAHDRLAINSSAFEQRLAPKLSMMRRSAPISELIAVAEKERGEAAETIQKLNVALHGLGEQLKTSQKALHESSLENIALQAKVTALSDHQSPPGESEQSVNTGLLAEIKGLEALVASLRFEADKSEQSYQVLLLEKEADIASLRKALSIQGVSKSENANRSQLEKLRADVQELRMELTELGARHQALRVKLAAATAAEELARQQSAQLGSALGEANERLRVSQEEERNLVARTGEMAQLQAGMLSAHEQRSARLQEQVKILSQAWGALFSSRAWRLFRKLSGHKDLPPLELPGGRTFDAAFYLARYPDVKAAGFEPKAHYLSHGLAEGREAHPQPETAPALVMLDSADLSASDTQVSLLSACESIAQPVMEHVRPTAVSAENDEPFDAQFYLAIYPDIAKAGINPEQHYRNHGRFEGRLGAVPKIPLSQGISPPSPGKSRILLISHEASRTGAPILSLNIVQQLTTHYDVVAMIFGGGPLEQAFIDAGAVVAGPVALKHRPIDAHWVLNQFLDQYDFEFAIVNSLESYVALKPLADRYIPTVSLIHEFAVYTRPKTAIQNALLWASETVFSADVTLDSATCVLPELRPCGLPVLAQGKSVVPGEAEDNERLEAEKRAIEQLMRPNGLDDGTVVILGAGWVQIRKGVDLFIECATRVLKSPLGAKCRFVWIGNNYDPEHDTLYSVYLHDQIQRAGIEDRFTVIKETAAIEHVYRLSDMLLLTSRLDPLPNVAIDAMVQGLPVLCFDRTTGVADILKRNDLEADCVAPYLDTGYMAGLLCRLAASETERARVGRHAQAVAAREFNMQTYVQQLIGFAKDNGISAEREAAAAHYLHQASVLDLDYYTPAAMTFHEPHEAIRRYVRSWARGVLRRKAFPGFEPALYKELNQDQVGHEDPLVHYLKAGRPHGSWRTRQVEWKAEIDAAHSPTALLFVTVDGYETLQLLTTALETQAAAPELVVLVGNELIALNIRRQLAEELRAPLRIIVCTEQPLAAMYDYIRASETLDYAVVGHLDLAGAPVDIDFSSMDAYRTFLIENLIGGHQKTWQNLVNVLAEPTGSSDIGLIYPDDPNVHVYPEDMPLLTKLCDRLGYASPGAQNTPFPLNGAFLCAPSLLRTLLSQEEVWASVFKHARLSSVQQERLLARLLVHAAESAGKAAATTVVAGITY